MRKEFLDILACPLCKGKLDLKVEEEQDEDVITGTLHCDRCKNNYPIESTIPNLLPPNLRLT